MLNKRFFLWVRLKKELTVNSHLCPAGVSAELQSGTGSSWSPSNRGYNLLPETSIVLCAPHLLNIPVQTASRVNLSQSNQPNLSAREETSCVQTFPANILMIKGIDLLLKTTPVIILWSAAH